MRSEVVWFAELMEECVDVANFCMMIADNIREGKWPYFKKDEEKL
jgi:hypothetical protein